MNVASKQRLDCTYVAVKIGVEVSPENFTEGIGIVDMEAPSREEGGANADAILYITDEKGSSLAINVDDA